ncbi:MAG: DUF5696 domain-containing protein [Dictyoglomus sp.]|nr:DUF5696 domain-containing protein [Dictyoglomus sp.]MDW8188234.1 DUF5696 domain-containing protein [Dictyoglomus sp.]
MLKKIFIIFLLIGIIPLYGKEVIYKKIAENHNFSLLFNEKDGSIAIEDKGSKELFKQFPEDWERDFSFGITKFSIPSHLVLEMVDEEGKITTYNTYALGIMRNNFRVSKIERGVRIDYDFPIQEIKISIEFILNSSGLSVRIPINSIKEPKDLKINRIWLLPYFLSGTKKDDGYLLVPDGSGAIIRFRESYGTERGFELPLYGYDKGLPLYDMPPKNEGLRLPIFGIKRNDWAVLGVIKSGDYSASIASYIAGNSTGYYRVYPVFTYRSIHKFLLYEREVATGQAGEVVDVLVNKISPYHLNKDIVVDYYFLKGKDANYSGMGRIFREYLIKNNILKKKIKDNSLYLNLSFIGGIKIKTTFLGIPMERFSPLTTFENAIRILEEFRKEGIENINLIYRGYQPGGYLGKITNGIKFEKKLGGERDFKKLLDFCKRNNINLSLSAEIIEIHEEGNGFSPPRDANRYINNGLAFLYKWDPVTKKKNRDYEPWFNVLPEKIPFYFKNFLRDIEKYGIKNVLVENIGDYIYSQNKKPKLLSREEVVSILHEVFGETVNKVNLLFTHGNFYTLLYSSLILDLPLDCSNYAIESEPVPFYQIVIHGYIPYSGRPGNLRENHKKDFLRMVEYGALPYYLLIYEDSSLFRKSFYNEMLSSYYKDWFKKAVEEYKKIEDLYKSTVNVPIKIHEKLEEGLYRTVYENGVEVVVNYNLRPLKYKEKLIEKESFIYFKS